MCAGKALANIRLGLRDTQPTCTLYASPQGLKRTTGGVSVR